MEIAVNVSGKPRTFVHDNTTFIQHFNIVSSTRPTHARSLEIPIRQVIAASFDIQKHVLSVTYMRRKKSKGLLSAVIVDGVVAEEQKAQGAKFVESILNSAYQGVKRGRHLKVLVNPHGGVGNGSTIFSKTVEPMLRAAGCTLDITYTTHSHHAYEIAQALPLVFDAVVSVSGDGLIHEILNGFANHDSALQALATPIAPIPTGSGNGLSLNLLGLKDGFDVSVATLNVIKGLPMKVDVFSVLQNGNRTLSFMSQALGLMADLDLGTEHLRWMGDTRFVIGMLQGLIRFKACPIELSYKATEVDKVKMVETWHSSRQSTTNVQSTLPLNETSALPSLKYSKDDTEGWTTFDKPILFVYAGKGPYVGRDLMAFPVSLPNDGLIDIVAQSVSSRSEILKSFPTAHTGKMFWNSSFHYIKAHAYRVKPLTKKGFLSIDGESFPFQEFQVEIHQELATWLSPFGFYAAEFHPHKETHT